MVFVILALTLTSAALFSETENADAEVNELGYEVVNGVMYYVPYGSDHATVVGTGGDQDTYSIAKSIGHEGNIYPVTVIGARSFSGSTMTTLEIPESIEKIEANAFENCRNLAIIRFNAVDCEMGWRTDIFSNAGVENGGIEVIFGDKVTNVPSYMFNTSAGNEANVVSVTISSSVKE